MQNPVSDPETMLNQFNRLMQDLFRESVNRNCFHAWEIELLLDIQSCKLRESNKREILRRYQRMVQRHLENGGETLPKLSEFLNKERGRARTGSEPRV